MKILLVSLVLLVLTAAGIHLVLEEPGYALLAYGETSVEMSLFVFSLLSVFVFAALYLLIGSVGRAWQIPARVHRRSEVHRRQKARDGLARGLTALAEGRWRDAEKALTRSVRGSSVPLLHYLGAAQAAQMLGEPETVERHLEEAAGCDPTSDMAVALARAEAAASQDRHDLALAVLRQLIERVPRGGYEVVLMARILAGMEAWKELLEVLPQLRYRRELQSNEVSGLKHRAVCGALDDAAKTGDLNTARAIWTRLDRGEREDPAFVAAYAQALRTLGEPNEAEAVVQSVLNRQWDEGLAYLYGVLEHSDPSRALRQAEKWLKAHENSPGLLLSLGRLCTREQLWGKARLYFESSLGFGPRAETYQELGRLLQQIGETPRAEECYRKGLKLAVDGVAEPLDEHSEAKPHPVKEAQTLQPDIYPV